MTDAGRGGPDELVVLRTYGNEFEAHTARAVLDAHDIDAHVFADHAGGLQPSLAFVLGVRLIVRREDALRANAVLDADA